MRPQLTEKSPTPAYVALLAVQALFGTLPVIGKVVLAVIPPVGLVGLRVGITALVLYAVQRYRGRVRLREPGDYKRLAVLSIFGVTLNQLLFVGGLSLTKASNTSLLAVTIPIFAILAGAAYGTEKLRVIKIAGIVMAAAGVLYLIDPATASFSSETTLGDMMIVVNSLSYGIYVAVSKDVITRNGAFRSMMWVFIFAAVICVPLGMFSLASVDIASVSPGIWALVLYVALGATAAPYLLNAWALARVSPSTVAVFVYMQPVIGFITAAIFLGETIDRKFVAAVILIFGGVYLVTKRQRL